MRYRLIFAIRFDERKWKREAYRKNREEIYRDLITRFPSEGAKIEDWRIEFPNGTPRLADALKDVCEAEGYEPDIGTFVHYSAKEIREAGFVRLMASSGPIDRDADHRCLNSYRVLICDTCGRRDQSLVPNPYYVDKKIMRRYEDLYYASNGVMILSVRAFESLREKIEPWVDFGQVVIKSEGKVVKGEVDYVWIRPKFEVGPFIDARVIKRCRKCKQPTEVRRWRLDDVFLQNMEVVESFKGRQELIVRAGTWCGEVKPERSCSLLEEIFVSGALHEYIRKLKLKGFCKADHVIHSLEEPQIAALYARFMNEKNSGYKRTTKKLRLVRTICFWSELVENIGDFLQAKLYLPLRRTWRKNFPSKLDKVRGTHILLPFADEDTEASCPVSIKEILEYLDYEAPGGKFAGGVTTIDFELKFLRMAVVKNTKYWIWSFLDENDTECYVTVLLGPDGKPCIGYSETLGLTPEQSIMAAYWRRT